MIVTRLVLLHLATWNSSINQNGGAMSDVSAMYVLLKWYWKNKDVKEVERYWKNESEMNHIDM